MAFTDPLDPTTPEDDALVSEGDDRIRELKRALVERLSQVIAGFPDTDPLQLIASTLDDSHPTMATFKIGLIAARPNPPDTDFYWATDESILYVSQPTEADPDVLEWIQVTIPATTLRVQNIPTHKITDTFQLTVSSAANPGLHVERQIATDLEQARYSFKSVRVKVKEQIATPTEQYWAYGLNSQAVASTLVAGFKFKVDQIFTDAGSDTDLVNWWVVYQFDNDTGSDQDVEVTIEVELWDHGEAE